MSNKDFEELVGYLEKKFSGVDKRFDVIDAKFIGIDRRLNAVGQELAELRAAIRDLTTTTIIF